MLGFEKYAGIVSTPSSRIAVQCLMIVALLSVVGLTLAHWFVASSSLRLPISIFLFYTVKFLSDTSLTLKGPPKPLWQDMNLLGFTLTQDMLFHANVDSFTGLCLLACFYYMGLRKLNRRCAC